MALRDGVPRFVFGTPGRHAQVQTNFQVATGLLDFGLGVQEAIEQPRWFHDSGLTLSLEGRFPGSTLTELANMGHQVQALDDWSEKTGGMQAIEIEDSIGSTDDPARPERDERAPHSSRHAGDGTRTQWPPQKPPKATSYSRVRSEG